MKGILRCLVGIMLVAPPLWAANGEYGPELTIDLRQFGYELPEPRGQFVLSTGPHNAATFLDNNTLGISMFVRNPRPGLSVQGKVLGGEYLFQTIFLDAKSGDVGRKEQWSNATIDCGLFFAPNGHFLVWHDRDLALYGSDGTKVQVLQLDDKRFPRAVALEQSVSGNILFAKRIDRDGNHILFMRTADLQKIMWLDLPGYASDSGSDLYFAFMRDHLSMPPPPMDLFVLKLDDLNFANSGMNPIFTSPAPGCLSVTFLDEQTVGLGGACHDLTILNISGETAYHKRYDKEFVGGIVACRNCSLLVSGTYVLTGGNAFLDIAKKTKQMKVILFDRNTRKLVEFPYPGVIKNVGSEALSPDGCLLAIQTDSLLRIYNTCDSPLGKALHPGLTQR